MNVDTELQQLSTAIDEGVLRIETCSDPATRSAALELMRSVMQLHRSAFERMLAIVEEQSDGAIIDSFADDDLINGILMLHDLHPYDLETRVTRALAKLQPQLLRHNASAKIISTGEGFVEIRLEAPRHCGATTDDLKMLVEKCLLDAAPDAQISVTASQPRADFVALDTLRAVATER